MIYKCENCKNRNGCTEKKDGYEKLCKDIENVNKTHYPNCYYSITLKCDYWDEDKETYNDVGEVPCQKGGVE